MRTPGPAGAVRCGAGDLVRLRAIGADELAELITDGWRCQAPRALVRELDRHRDA
jgi:hypothetical protein